ncbi:hypothetical protein VCRA2116O30_30079 [Vibrio crassostreae]|nr:hypothetical protein VCRA2116O26_30120 [Vibrio crassostreae]CAK2070756.1 hypothetical protein VCRA2116O30_30079 [Vibrio crassostreae]CAK2086096.1 hypothetical protein VCRA2117O40_30122 [Vibrio crassostreae]CAK2089404.1 hypothetical protein VCRA2116O27_30123 [Vibrio crassostreae]CAK2103763.1 hypothetical protein VCRA2116O28_30302 [Vibrio crassostreae]
MPSIGKIASGSILYGDGFRRCLSPPWQYKQTDIEQVFDSLLGTVITFSRKHST